MKTALITGATSGIGRACAIAFANAGYDIIAIGSSESSDWSVLAAVIKTGQKASKLVCNLLETEAAPAELDNFDCIDVLVNAAGIVDRTNQNDVVMFKKTLHINTIMPWVISEYVQTKGCSSIVNIGSMRALHHQAKKIDYSTSKAALHNMTVALARAYAGQCRVNCIAPGFTQTNMHVGMHDRLKAEAAKTPTGKTITPEEIADIAVFLTKNESINGEIIVADGGRNFSDSM